MCLRGGAPGSTCPDHSVPFAGNPASETACADTVYNAMVLHSPSHMCLPRLLFSQLAARDVSVGEYLYCFRTVALPLLGSEWELRYVVLSGQSLKQYKSAKDLCYNPREETNIMVGGLKGGRPHLYHCRPGMCPSFCPSPPRGMPSQCLMLLPHLPCRAALWSGRGWWSSSMRGSTGHSPSSTRGQAPHC